MATAAAPEPLEPSEMECSVCHEYFTQPKILPCAHLLCQHCLVSWLNSHPDARCPLCRCAIVESEEPRACAQEVVDALPTDVTMAGLVAGARALSQDHVCVVCEDKEAQFICLDCNDMLCQNCLKPHGKLSSSKHHKTADLTSMTPERLAASRHVPCTAHAQEYAKLFCTSHKEAICQLCATSRHRACVEVRELEEQFSEMRRVLGEMLKLLTGGEIQLEAAIRELDDHLLQVEKKTERTLADITATCDDLKKAVDAFGSQMREAALSAKCKAREEAEQVKSTFVQRKGKLTSHKQLVQRTQRVATHTSEGDVPTLLKTRVEGLDRSVTLPVGMQVITMPTLIIDQQAIERVQRELKAVCKLKNAPAKLSFQAMVSHKPFAFHAKHGKNVKLSNDQRTAERVQGVYDGVVFSSQPMKGNKLYEVVIEQNVPYRLYSGVFGITTADPATLSVPVWGGDLPRHATVVICNQRLYNHAFGNSVNTAHFENELLHLSVGSRVGVYMDAGKSLHFLLDGIDQGIICNNVPDTCYAYFDLRFACKKFTTLPLTHMP